MEIGDFVKLKRPIRSVELYKDDIGIIIEILNNNSYDVEFSTPERIFKFRVMKLYAHDLELITSPNASS